MYAGLASDWSGLGPTNGGSFPSSGSPRYQGVLQLATIGGEEFRFQGRLVLVADFDNAEVLGAADKLIDDRNTAFDGSLVVGTGWINPAADSASDYQFGGDLFGAFSGGAKTYVIDARLVGDFLGEDAPGAGGLAEGFLTVDDADLVIIGQFFAER